MQKFLTIKIYFERLNLPNKIYPLTGISLKMRARDGKEKFYFIIYFLS